ncbi:hypothetical protein ACQKIY_25045 [Bacillus mycoides]|uniref:hypothetical protein n=1 Tax=Bacillus mycoides TaxID=1405 RepID=UPI003CFD0C0C
MSIYKLPLDDDVDVDIQKWMDKIPRNKKAEVIRHAIRLYKSQLKEGEFFYYPSGEGVYKVNNTQEEVIEEVEPEEEERPMANPAFLTSMHKVKKEG